VITRGDLVLDRARRRFSRAGHPIPLPAGRRTG
jgi:hypothetical protein